MPSNNALHTAAIAGNLAQAQVQARNFDINAKGEKGRTALCWAAEEGKTEVVKLLLTLNASVNIPDDKGWAPLHCAATNGHTDIVRALIASPTIKINAAPCGAPALICAIIPNCHIDVVRALITSPTIDVNCADHGSIIGGGIQQGTALTWAAYYGDKEIVKALLRVNGIKINHVDYEDRTAVYWATKNGNLEAVKALVDAGADLSIACTNGLKPNDLCDIEEEGPFEEIRNVLRRGSRRGGGGGGGGGGGVPPPSSVRSYAGPASMTFRDTSRGVLASGRSVAAHTAAALSEESKLQELALRLDALCRRGEFPDLSAVTRLLSKPTGQSVVFEGVYQRQQVAVKVFLDRTTKDTAANEVAYLRRCAHRHVLRALNMYEYNGRALLVMPMADGDLNGVIDKAEGPLPYDQVTRYVKQVAIALTFLHDEKSVAHLDLKAGNVFIAKSDGRVLLADFGMAMDIADINRDQLLACGTPLFQAPELWAQRLGDPVQRGNRAKVDVYAFGCMVWQLLTRQCPFQRECETMNWIDNDFLLLATAVRRERRSPAGMMEDRWPEPLRRVIQACCAYEPANRPTMAELLSKAKYLG